MNTIYKIAKNEKNLNFNVEIFGWIKKIRKLGSIIFLDVYDMSGMIQVFIEEDNVFFDKIYSIPKESVVKIKGLLRTRKSINNEIPTGHVEILLENFEVISLSKNTPFLIQENTDGLEELRLKYRYLDLRRSNMQKNLIFRSKFIQKIREFLYRKEVIEIETPILSKKTPEGANEYLVSTKNDLYFSLSQSPQIYKQLLMTSGFNKYFQVAKCFRNEDLRLDRQPEFTQLDMEFSFIDEDYIFNFTEGMFRDVFLKMLNMELKIPFQKMNYEDAISFYGTDKPNTGYDYKIFESTSFLKESIFFKKFIEKGKIIKSIIIDDFVIEKNNLKKIEKFAKDNNASSLISAVFDSKIIGGSLFGKIENEIIEKIFENQKIKKGTIFFDFNKGNESNKILGSIRSSAIEILEIKPKSKFNFVWIVNWPLFEYSKVNDKYVSMHHPFTSPIQKDKENILNNFKTAIGRSYDLVLNGFEIGGGSIRISNKELQENIFKILKIDEKIYKKEFNFLLDAFDFGMPPHGGIAFGLDRILMILLNTSSIRDVIAFPKNSSGNDLMLNSPNKIN